MMKFYKKFINNKEVLTVFALLLTFALVLSGCADDIDASSKDSMDIEEIEVMEEVKTEVSSSETIKDEPDIPLSSTPLTAHFIDVGQGDSILFVTPEGRTMLIDAGDRGAEDRIISYIKDQGISKIDVVIATHPHADHIGGMADVLKTFEIGEIHMPRVMHTTKTFENLLETIQSKGLKIKTAKAGVELDIDPNIKATMVAPNSDEYDNLNDYSVVLKVSHGKNSFLLTGDAEKLSEKEILKNNHDISADVLKVGHHGSSTSTTDEFLNKVNPKHAIILLGKDNSYGHPHREITDKLNAKGIKIYRTDELGNIIVTSDGEDLVFSNSKSEQPVEKEVVKEEKKVERVYIGNKNSKIFHLPTCSSLPAAKNQVKFSSKDDAINAGHRACNRCEP